MLSEIKQTYTKRQIQCKVTLHASSWCAETELQSGCQGSQGRVANQEELFSRYRISVLQDEECWCWWWLHSRLYAHELHLKMVRMINCAVYLTTIKILKNKTEDLVSSKGQVVIPLGWQAIYITPLHTLRPSLALPEPYPMFTSASKKSH